jgi:hypothetical protein
LISVCDDEVNPALQVGITAFDTSGFQAAILQGETAMEVAYFDENNIALSIPLPNPLLGGSQKQQ